MEVGKINCEASVLTVDKTEVVVKVGRNFTSSRAIYIKIIK